MLYYPFNRYLRDRFGEKVRRISLNAGFPCPNDEGTRCIYCNEYAFSSFAGGAAPLKEQIELSLQRAKIRSNVKKFIAYFQNGTATNAAPEELKAAYDTIRDHPEIVGLFISTRPDCVDGDKLDLIAGYLGDYDVWIEYGLQTIHGKSLELIKRGHTWEQSRKAVMDTAARGIKAGAHIILGLPGETSRDMVQTAKSVSSLPVSGVKLHVLHVLKNTPLEKMYMSGEVKVLSRGEYIKAACDFLENLREDCVILRLVSDARSEYLVSPEWINDKLSVINDIEKELSSRGTRQGCAAQGAGGAGGGERA